MEKKYDPMEKEYEFILEREVEQQLLMEDLVQQCAIISEDTIIFLWNKMPLCRLNV